VTDWTVAVGLKSQISGRDLDGYEVGLVFGEVNRLEAVAAAYRLPRASDILNGPGTYNRLEAGFLARELRDLAALSRDEGLVAACEALAMLADRCKSSSDPTEELWVRIP
jgi:hypothetical protein